MNDLCLNVSLFSWIVNRLGFSLTNNSLFSAIVLMKLAFSNTLTVSHVTLIACCSPQF